MIFISFFCFFFAFSFVENSGKCYDDAAFYDLICILFAMITMGKNGKLGDSRGMIGDCCGTFCRLGDVLL